MGYQIDSSPKLGYSFVASTSLLLPEEIQQNLETNIIGKRILYYPEVVSTQDTAERLARNGAEEGTVVISETQARGRGRKGRVWISPAGGGLYLSIILRPSLVPSQIVQIPLIAGVAITKAIMHITNLQPKIKWPNDIFIAGKKVAGILAEMNCEVDRVNYVVLGMGINVNTPGTLLADTTGGIGTSLEDQRHEAVSRLDFVRDLFREFEIVYMEFLTSGFNEIREEWKKLDGTIGSQVTVTEGREIIKGKALDIDEEGFLLVSQENGNIKRIINGDVSLQH